MRDRRKILRRKTLMLGMIITHDRFATINCLVRNTSDSGARIEIESAVALPCRFELLFDGKSRHCDLTWKSAHHAGVRFA